MRCMIPKRSCTRAPRHRQSKALRNQAFGVVALVPDLTVCENRLYRLHHQLPEFTSPTLNFHTPSDEPKRTCNHARNNIRPTTTMQARHNRWMPTDQHRPGIPTDQHTTETMQCSACVGNDSTKMKTR